MTKFVTMLILTLGLAVAGCADSTGAADTGQPEPTSDASVETTELTTTTSATTTTSRTTSTTTSTTTTTSPPTTVATTTTLASVETPWAVPIQGEVGPGENFPTLLLSQDGIVNRQVKGGNNGLVNLPHDTGDVFGVGGVVVVERTEPADDAETVTELLVSIEGSNFDLLDIPEGIQPLLLDVGTVDGQVRILAHLHDPQNETPPDRSSCSTPWERWSPWS